MDARGGFVVVVSSGRLSKSPTDLSNGVGPTFLSGNRSL